jgi:hypothetical protein
MDATIANAAKVNAPDQLRRSRQAQEAAEQKKVSNNKGDREADPKIESFKVHGGEKAGHKDGNVEGRQAESG